MGTDPCANTICGVNAACEVAANVPICVCFPNFNGNPHVKCSQEAQGNLLGFGASCSSGKCNPDYHLTCRLISLNNKQCLCKRGYEPNARRDRCVENVIVIKTRLTAPEANSSEDIEDSRKASTPVTTEESTLRQTTDNVVTTVATTEQPATTRSQTRFTVSPKNNITSVPRLPKAAALTGIFFPPS